MFSFLGRERKEVTNDGPFLAVHGVQESSDAGRAASSNAGY